MSMQTWLDLASPKVDGARAPHLLVMLPGAYEAPESFFHQGLVAAVRARQLPVDVMVVDAHADLYMAQTILQQLHDEVVAPARAQGYASIWLLGISLGGMGAMLYTATHPEQIAGVVALAPYLGPRHISVAAERAGGLQAWPTAAYPPPDDVLDWRLWRWLKSHVTQPEPERETDPIEVGQGAEPARGAPLYWGYGETDRFAHGHRVVARALPAAQVAVAGGAHDWPTWQDLWLQLLDRLPWRAEPAEPARAGVSPRASGCSSA
jgi:pimeloyl-ACP methyl ester carboxylesterase